MYVCTYVCECVCLRDFPLSHNLPIAHSHPPSEPAIVSNSFSGVGHGGPCDGVCVVYPLTLPLPMGGDWLTAASWQCSAEGDRRDQNYYKPAAVPYCTVLYGRRKRRWWDRRRKAAFSLSSTTILPSSRGNSRPHSHQLSPNCNPPSRE